MLVSTSRVVQDAAMYDSGIYLAIDRLVTSTHRRVVVGGVDKVKWREKHRSTTTQKLLKTLNTQPTHNTGHQTDK